MGGGAGTPRQRRWPVVAAVLGVLLLGAGVLAWTWARDQVELADDDPRPDPMGEQVDLAEPGFHRLPSLPDEPPERRRYHRVEVWTGTELVVWGGTAEEGDGSIPGRTLGTGASMDLDGGRWRPLPPSPFPDGLYASMGAWDGTEVIVIGTACEAEVPPATDGTPPPCPDGPAAIAYDPVAATWRRLPPPPIPVDTHRGEPVLVPQVALGGDGAATFVSGYDGQAIAWDRAEESWDLVDPAVGDDEGSVDVCADPLGGQVAAVQVFPPFGQDGSRAWTLPLGASSWSEPVTLGAPFDRGPTCSEGLVVGARWDPEGSRARLYDLDTGTGEPIGSDPALAAKTAHLIGPWVVVENLEAEEPGGDPVRSLDVRRLDGDDWTTFDQPDRFSTTRAQYLDGVGILGVRSMFEGDSIVVWRLPPELIG